MIASPTGGMDRAAHDRRGRPVQFRSMQP